MGHYGTLRHVMAHLAIIAHFSIINPVYEYLSDGFQPHLRCLTVNVSNNVPFGTLASLAKPVRPL